MQVFIHKKLAHYMKLDNLDDPFRSSVYGLRVAPPPTTDHPSFDPNQMLIPPINGVLDLSGRVSSSRFSNFSTGLISIGNIINLLPPSPHTLRESVTKLNLFNCNLFDEDVKFVYDLVKQLPNCHTVNLRSNRIHGVALVNKFIYELVDLPSINFVDICYNALTPTDQRNFLRSLNNQNGWSKLIWIPQHGLHEEEWLAMADPQHRDTIKTVHAIYYG
jgi:hypothetical protein